MVRLLRPTKGHERLRVVFVFLVCTNSRSGLGRSIQQVVIGRLIAGVGGAGVNCLVAIVIAGEELSE